MTDEIQVATQMVLLFREQRKAGFLKVTPTKFVTKDISPVGCLSSMEFKKDWPGLSGEILR